MKRLFSPWLPRWLRTLGEPSPGGGRGAGSPAESVHGAAMDAPMLDCESVMR